MEEAQVRVWYDSSVDILYMLFKEGISHEVVEAGPDVVLELSENREIMGLEIWNAKKNGVIMELLKALEH